MDNLTKAINELREKAKIVNELESKYTALTVASEEVYEQLTKAKEVMVEVERKIRGVIYEETHINE